LIHNAKTGKVEFWKMDGTDWRADVDLPTSPSQDWKIGGTADVNQDGSVDILWRNQNTGQNQVWYLDRGAQIGSADLPSLTDTNQTMAGVGDYNQDGNADILWHNQATGENTVWLMDGVQQIRSMSLPVRTDTSWQTDNTVDLAQTPSPNPTPTPTPTPTPNPPVVPTEPSPPTPKHIGPLWDQPGGKGTPITLTYSFVDGFFDHIKIKGGSPNDVKASVEKALSVYAKYAPINFVEVPDKGPDSHSVRTKGIGIEPGDTQLRFHAYYKDGDGGVFGTTWLPSKSHAIGGDIFMDYETWDSTAELVEDFAHELGHALGLEHSSDPNALMYPSTWDRYPTLESADLLAEDILAIQTAYGKGQGSVKTLGGGAIIPEPQPEPQPKSSEVIGPDFNGDGKVDLLWQNTTTGQVQAWSMNGDELRLRSNPIAAYAKGFEVRAVGDFNGDGQNDLILKDTSRGSMMAWFLNGAQRTGTKTIFQNLKNTDEEVRGAADFDGDGQTDLLIHNAKTGKVEFWKMDGTDWSADVDLPTSPGPDWKIGGTADINQDGSVDILWRNQTTGQNQVWYLDRGAQIGSANLPSLMDANQTMAGLGDYNQDGKVDVLWRNQSTGANTVWLMDGVRQVGSLTLHTLPDLAWQTDIIGEASQTPNPNPTPTPIGKTIVGTSLKDTLQGAEGNDLIQGLKGPDTLSGLAGDDEIRGGGGIDIIDGGDGNDRIIGGKARDVLTGGKGADTFVYNSVDHGGDRIVDFEAGIDKIEVSNIFSDVKYGSANAFADYIQILGTTEGAQIQVDQLGDMGDHFKTLATLQGVDANSLNASHFVV
ncbi:MAG: FG-GAP-like repeat-containing protein, partial [Leptolyngbyaceae cyanobacterium MO_188.B28]|nr:FG-GAP-like repeat-containing protein [Leptolyngbyaceae cyanobacterium MO_188.B28]